MRKNRKFWIALIIFSLTGQIAWVVENMYFNVFIYKMFRASAADIALMVTASSVAATLTTILIGALSDRIGKRKIFMCTGYIAWGISIISSTSPPNSRAAHAPSANSSAAAGPFQHRASPPTFTKGSRYSHSTFSGATARARARS